jgi:hypothetical protein
MIYGLLLRAAMRIALALLLLGGQAHAQMDGMKLHGACNKDAPNSIGDVFCNGYTLGFLEGFIMGAAQLTVGKRLVCLPEREAISAAQLRVIVQKYLRDHPEELHKLDYELVTSALVAAFPCPN